MGSVFLFDITFIVHANLCTHILVSLVSLVDTRPRDGFDFKMAAKSFGMFTIQGAHGLLGPFNIVFAAYCCFFVFLLRLSIVFYMTLHFS